MTIGKKRKEAVWRSIGLVGYYLVAFIAGLILWPLSFLRAFVDIGWQFLTNSEGLSDDGYIPKAQHRLDGFRDWSLHGSDDASWRR